MYENQKLLASALIRHDFKSFIGKVFSSLNPGQNFQPNWHIDYIAEHLEAARIGQLKRLIINMPPRSLKSICVSVAWPAWILAHQPNQRIMAASYAQPLSLKHSLDTRDIIESKWYQTLFPHTRLSHVQNEKYKFLTTQHGFRFATSVGGVATGEGGNYLIVDDPINPKQSMHSSYRDEVNHWFENTFATRLDHKKDGVIVLVMQRLHPNDLSGYLLEKGGWEHLCLPMVAPENSFFSFGEVMHYMHEGDFLHATRDDANVIAALKRDIGSYAFEAQYQQQPVAVQGGMIQTAWLKRYSVLPEAARVVQSWDTAIKCQANHDASVCVTMFETADASYVAHVLRVRAEYPDLKRQIIRMSEAYSPDAILIEDKASGQQLLQDLKRESKLPLIAILPKGDKFSRVSAASGTIEAGKIVLPKTASWSAEFEHELLEFPNGKHDDQVDALCQYIQWQKQGMRAEMSIRSL